MRDEHRAKLVKDECMELRSKRQSTMLWALLMRGSNLGQFAGGRKN